MSQILIDCVRIAGFRGIRNLEIPLSRATTLIGTNNSGKTSVIKALQLALGDYQRQLAEEDFHIGVDQKRVDEILVDVRIVAVNEKGQRIAAFEDEWSVEFGDKIKAEANGFQFVALRTRTLNDLIKGTFDCKKYFLEKWSDLTQWKTEKIKETLLTRRFESIPFISIDAQRDIHQELKEKSSFVGKVLASVEYQQSDIAELESLIEHLNKEAIDKSGELQSLKSHLDNLNESFQGSGKTEITPFPKKIRDLSKNFSVHFGQSSTGSFSMEYHGMGTRSWASMLTVIAFVDLVATKQAKEVQPFFPILAAEEPEAHLHPNAQKIIYQQLATSKFIGQVLISTHSPYVAAVSAVHDIRSLKNSATGIVVNRLTNQWSVEDLKIISREITNKRGDILFSKALILCEGITEEQVIPAMFELHFGKSLYSAGVSCISVGGKNYKPFLRLASCFGIPTCIVSDNDGSTESEVKAQITKLSSEPGISLGPELFAMSFMASGNNFEKELMSLGIKEEIVSAVVSSETNGSENPQYIAAKKTEIGALSDSALLTKMESIKASYAGFLGDVLRSNPNTRIVSDLIPPAVASAFGAVKGWVGL